MNDPQDTILVRNFAFVIVALAGIGVGAYLLAQGIYSGFLETQQSDDLIVMRTEPVGQVNTSGEPISHDQIVAAKTAGQRDTATTVAADSAETEAEMPEAEMAAAAEVDAETSVASAHPGKGTYEQVCYACHTAGIAGAPKFGDAAVWKPRLEEKGLDTLVSHAINGYQGEAGVMPAKGGLPTLTDQQVKESVEYMLVAAGLDVGGEPAPAAAAAASESEESGAPETDQPEAGETETAAAEQPAAEKSAAAEPAAAETSPAPATETAAKPSEAEAAESEPMAETEQPAPAASATAEADAAPAPAASAEAAEPAEEQAADQTADSETETPAAESEAALASTSGRGKEVYEGACYICHTPGAAGAPMLGDNAAWQPRLAKGKETLYTHAIGGFMGEAGLMPPKGGRPDLSDDDVKAAVDYMVSSVKP